MRYVALLRGINVGGNNIIPMASLVKTFEGLGFEAVRSYIASGNVLFESETNDARKLERAIEGAVLKRHQVESATVVRSQDEMAATLRALPGSWKRPSAERRYNVMFLRHEVDSEAVLERIEVTPGVEELIYGAGALFWSAKIAGLARSKVAKLNAKALYRQLTVRNLNTTKKLAELISG